MFQTVCSAFPNLRLGVINLYHHLVISTDTSSWYHHLVISTDTSSWYHHLVISTDTSSWFQPVKIVDWPAHERRPLKQFGTNVLILWFRQTHHHYISSCDFDRHIIMISSSDFDRHNAYDFDRHIIMIYHHFVISTDTSAWYQHVKIVAWPAHERLPLTRLGATPCNTAWYKHAYLVISTDTSWFHHLGFSTDTSSRYQLVIATDTSWRHHHPVISTDTSSRYQHHHPVISTDTSSWYIIILWFRQESVVESAKHMHDKDDLLRNLGQVLVDRRRAAVAGVHARLEDDEVGVRLAASKPGHPLGGLPVTDARVCDAGGD